MKSLGQSLNWVDQQEGKWLDWDGKWGGQCLDIVAYYLQFHGVKWPGAPRAVDLWSKNISGFKKVHHPAPGAIAVWGNVANGDGHVSIVREVYPNGTFKSIDQNAGKYYNPNKGSNAYFMMHDMGNIVGFFLPEYAPEPAPIKPTPAPPATPAAPPAQQAPRGSYGHAVNPSVVGKMLWLKGHVKRWRVYYEGKAPTPPHNVKAVLTPNAYRNGPGGQAGLSYKILGVAQFPQTVVIQTEMFGKVNIYVDSDAEIVD